MYVCFLTFCHLEISVCVFSHRDFRQPPAWVTSTIAMMDHFMTGASFQGLWSGIHLQIYEFYTDFGNKNI